MIFIYVSNTFGTHSQKVIFHNSLITLSRFPGVEFSICSGMSFSTSDFQIGDFHLYPCLLLKDKEGTDIMTWEKVTRVNLKANSTTLFSALTWDKLFNLSVLVPKQPELAGSLLMEPWENEWMQQMLCVLTMPDIYFCSVQAMLVLSLSENPWNGFLNDLNTSHSCREAIWMGLQGFHWPHRFCHTVLYYLTWNRHRQYLNEWAGL